MAVYEAILSKCLNIDSINKYFGHDMPIMSLFHMEHHVGDFFETYKDNFPRVELHSADTTRCDSMTECHKRHAYTSQRYYCYNVPKTGNSFVLHYITYDGWTDYVIAYKAYDGKDAPSPPNVEDILRQCNNQ